MPSHFIYSVLLIRTGVLTLFNYIMSRQSDSSFKGKSKTPKELKETKNEMKHEFMYLNKKIYNDTTDKKSPPENSAERKKYHFLLPH